MKWCSFIHGGAWRDPVNTIADFEPSIQQILVLPESIQQRILGFISIDYRLSESPDSSHNSSKLSANAVQNARHPDHIRDVQAALSFLADQIQLSNDYVLIGHSAGATLAYQVLMYNPESVEDSASSSPDQHLLRRRLQPPPPLPAAVVGVSGIYDLVGFAARLEKVSPGIKFIHGAFGEDKSRWAEASPARYRFTGSGWSGYSLLAHSPEDTLVDSIETMEMAAELSKSGLKVDVDNNLSGSHDFVWQEGGQVANLVAHTIRVLDHMS